MPELQSPPPAPQSTAKIGAFLFTLWQFIRLNAIVILVIIVGMIVFTKVGQSKEFFAGYVEKSRGRGPFKTLFSWFNLFVILWSVALWQSSRILMELKKIPLRESRLTRQFLYWTPQLLGGIPFLLFSCIFYSHGSCYPIYSVLLALQGLLFIFLISYNYILVKLFGIKKDKPKFSHRAVHLKKLLSDPTYKISVAFILLFLLFSISLFIEPLTIPVSRELGPGTVILSALSFFTIVLGILFFFNDNVYRPILIGLVIYMFLVSNFNDNQYISTSVITIGNSTTRHQHTFSGWLSSRENEQQTKNNDTIPIILVAAEGGGIRAMEWTGLMLQKLNAIPGFYNHVYAISGVSGGGVGATFYNAFYSDAYLNNKIAGNKDSLLFKTLTGDFLSPVTAAFLFPESFQSVIPFKIPPFDRARFLEDSWSATYKDNFNSDALDTLFLSQWGIETGYNYQLPSLFLNGVLAESGHKTIVSNLKLNSTYFPDVTDVLDTIKADVPVKTAALLCARFPFLTPGGKMPEVNKQKSMGHIVDGGYLENSGIQTASQILLELEEEMNKQTGIYDTVPVHYKFILLYLKNGIASVDTTTAIRSSHEMRVPLSAFLNAFGSSPDFYNHSFTDYLGDARIEFMQFELPRIREENLALGWYFSDTAALTVKNYADMLDDSIKIKHYKHPDAVPMLEKDYANYKLLQKELGK